MMGEDMHVCRRCGGWFRWYLIASWFCPTCILEQESALGDLIEASQVTALWALGYDDAGWPLRDGPEAE